MRHFAARMLRSARAMAALSVPQCQYYRQSRCLSNGYFARRPIRALAPQFRTINSYRSSITLVSPPLVAPLNLRSVKFFATASESEASEGEQDSEELDEAVEVDVLIEGEPLPSQR